MYLYIRQILVHHLHITLRLSQLSPFRETQTPSPLPYHLEASAYPIIRLPTLHLCSPRRHHRPLVYHLPASPRPLQAPTITTHIPLPRVRLVVLLPICSNYDGGLYLLTSWALSDGWTSPTSQRVGKTFQCPIYPLRQKLRGRRL